MSRLRSVALLAALSILASPVRGASGSGGPSSLDLMDVELMFVGAHPDDDMGVMATFARYSLDQGWKAAVVTLTAGEGGGNATGPEAGRSLGMVRREEERRALALAGVTAPHFMGLEDFYFTLSAEEVEKRWGPTFVCDVVRDVRLQRPEVIVTMWPGPGTHGQHQMAARAATLAYDRAGDPTFCPGQVKAEGLVPFAPAKLYYYEPAGTKPSISIGTEDMSRSARMRYADLKALAVSQYRSQGYDAFGAIPVKEPKPESFLLVRSRVPVSEPETHLLEGAMLPAGTSPAGVRLTIDAQAFTASERAPSAVTATLVNGTARPMQDVTLVAEPAAGWTARSRGPALAITLEPGASLEATFDVAPAPGSSAATAPLRVRYTARHDGHVVAGANVTRVRAAAPIRATFRPLFDVEGYRSFAKATGTEWVIESLPTRIPARVDAVTPVTIDVFNDGAARATGTLQLDLPAGVELVSPVTFDVPAAGHAWVQAQVRVTPAALPEGRHAVRLPIVVKAGDASRDAADLYLLPSLTIPRVATAPTIDGDLSDTTAFASTAIGARDLWWRKAPTDAADLSGDVRLAYDARNLYVAVRVRDEVVACNIAPDDVRSQLRSDAVGVTVDPTGRSRDTSTTLQAAAFPCTTAGFGARGFRDADARQGVIEETAPGMRVASKRTADGYDLEMMIPWAAMPSQPKPGDEIGLNVVLYDGDAKDARVGANISESGLAWSAFEWGGKQALPYVWGRVRLAR